MATDITTLEEGFNELSQYSDAQFKTIIELQSKIAQLESENRSLKTMLEQNLPAIGFDKTDFSLGISNEQLICETQLLMLKNAAIIAPLTLEETRKFQIFTDTLEKIRKNKPTQDDAIVTSLSPTQLIEIANQDERK